MKSNAQNQIIIGSDETGVGDYFTSLVVCAVCIKPGCEEQIRNLNLKDSKRYNSDTKIKAVANQIKPLVDCARVSLTPELYNEHNLIWNANELKTLLHIKAINNLFNYLKDEYNQNISASAIIDEFASLKNFCNYQKKITDYYQKFEPLKVDFELFQKAEDQFIEVAAASILAREFMIDELNERSKKYNFGFLLGASNEVDEQGYRFVKKFGFKKLEQVAKIKFKNTEKIKKKLASRK